MHISYPVDNMLIMITYTMCHKYHVNEQWTTNEPLKILINFSYTKKTEKSGDVANVIFSNLSCNLQLRISSCCK